MAVRSGAGTGVIVSLVVFIILTISMLALAIAFYTGQNKAETAQGEAEKALATYVTSQQQGSEQFRVYEQQAASNRQSVAGHLLDEYNSLATFVIDGDPKSVEEIQADLSNLGVDAFWHCLEPFEHTDAVECSVDLGVGRRPVGDTDVVSNRAIEEVPFLRHDDDPLSKRRQRCIRQVDTSVGDGALGGVVQPSDQLCEGRLSCTSGTDECYPLP